MRVGRSGGVLNPNAWKAYEYAGANVDEHGGLLQDQSQRQPPTYTTLQLLELIHRVSSSVPPATPSLATSSSSGRAKQYATAGLGSRLWPPPVKYFALAREWGIRAVDGLVKTGIVELRWGPCVKPSRRAGSGCRRDRCRGGGRESGVMRMRSKSNVNVGETGQEGLHPLAFARSEEALALEGVIEPLSDEDAAVVVDRKDFGNEDEVEGDPDAELHSPWLNLGPDPGPTLLPVSPLTAHAMRVVLAEYEYEDMLAEHENDHDHDRERRRGRGAETGVGAGAGMGAGVGTGVSDDEDRGTERGGMGRERGYRSESMSDDKSDYVSLSDVDEY
jgi:hypothetical protein